MIKIILLIFISIFTVSGQINNEFLEYLNDLDKEFDVPNIIADSIKQDQYLILDSREKEEYQVSHIKDAIWIGYDDFDISVLDSINHDKEIIVYCSVGYRSSKITLELYNNGFNNVYNLYGGIFNWANEGRELVANQNKTLDLHAYNSYWARFITNSKINKIY
jgi:rhodanese-related sulfurtransferase